MKALWLREVHAIVQREDFLSWWRSLLDLEEKLRGLQARCDELLTQVNLMDFRAEYTQKNAIDFLYRAGDHEDSAAQLMAESSEIENKSYEAVANFESQRIVVSDLFSKMGAVEHNFLSIQAEVRGLKSSLEAAKQREQREELQRLLKRKKADQSRLSKELQESSALYERGNSRKMSLWAEVEQMWTRSLDINLGVSERRMKGKRARKQAELLFKQAEQQKRQAGVLRQEAEETDRKKEELERTIEDLRLSARRLFGCLVGWEFLYWPCRENIKEVYCVPLHDRAEGFNIELRARNIYLADRQKGVEFIKPLPPSGEVREEEDGRIDDFFSRDKEKRAAPDRS